MRCGYGYAGWGKKRESGVDAFSEHGRFSLLCMAVDCEREGDGANGGIEQGIIKLYISYVTLACHFGQFLYQIRVNISLPSDMGLLGPSLCYFPLQLDAGPRRGGRAVFSELRGRRRTPFCPRRGTENCFFHEGPRRDTKNTFFPRRTRRGAEGTKGVSDQPPTPHEQRAFRQRRRPSLVLSNIHICICSYLNLYGIYTGETGGG